MIAAFLVLPPTSGTTLRTAMSVSVCHQPCTAGREANRYTASQATAKTSIASSAVRTVMTLRAAVKTITIDLACAAICGARGHDLSK